MKPKDASLAFLNVILLVILVVSVHGSVYNRYLGAAVPVSAETPKVVLEQGTTGNSTIYANKTSALASFKASRNMHDYVDNDISNVDSSANKGTHSSFTAQQAGPDSIYDRLTEEDTGPINNWGITSSTFTGTSTHTTYRYMGGVSPNLDNMKVTRLHIRYSGTGTVAIALYTGGTLTDPTGAVKRTEAYNVAVSNGWNTIDVPDYNWEKNTTTWIGWARSGGSVYYSTSSADAGNFQSARGRWEQTTPANADETSPMPTNPGSGSFSNYWYAMYVEYEIPNYQLDLEAQWTNATYNLSNEALCIFGGTMGSEDIHVDAWNGTAWHNLFLDLASGWNNVSVSSYLNSPTFTIRFKGGAESGDTVQDSWNIDATLLHVWDSESAYDYVLKVTNQVTNGWKINLQVYGSSNIGRISDAIMKFHDGTTSNQIIIQSGTITQTQGPPYDLTNSATVYISVSNLQATTNEESYLYVYLKILVPNTSTYNLLVVTFKIT
jgi:hypothetical protein